MIRIARGLSLPLDVVTQTIGVLARKRAGKSYTARRFAEQLFQAGQQIVIVDPKGDHWGIRSAADAKSPGLGVVIVGGEHADVPLEPSGGEVVAKLVVEERVSVLLDLGLLRKHEVATFMTAFLENLYRLKAREVHRTPVMLIIDEADAIAPQKPQPNEARMLGAAEDIVRRGGQRGIGCTMITQRSAVLAKDVLTQIQMLVVLRTIAPQDLKAIGEWINAHGTPEQGRELIDSLPALTLGDAWFWSPGWPNADGIFQRSKVLPIETFDSGATPKPGEKRVEPKHLADVDLDALRRQMADTIERAKADDPKLLRAELAKMRAELAQKPTAPTEKEPRVKRVEVPMLIEKDVKRFEAACERMQKVLDKHIAELAPYQERLNSASQEILTKMASAMAQERMPAPPPAVRREIAAATRPPAAPRIVREPSEGVTRPQQKVLDALAWFKAIGLDSASRVAVAGIAGVSSTSGAYANNLSALHTGGMVDYPRDGYLSLTAEGMARAESPQTPPTLAALHGSVLGVLTRPQAKILEVVLRAYPGTLTRDEVAAEIGVSPTSGAYANNISRLKTLSALDYPGSGSLVASALLFPAGLT